MNERRIELLWSGGWDSTFMLCKLAREYDRIQPYYIKFGRPGQAEEMDAMDRITKALAAHREIACEVMPVKIVPDDEIHVPGWLASCWEQFRGEPYKVGHQYLWLAAFAMGHKGIAVGQERYYETPGHLTRLMYELGHMKWTKEGVGYFDRRDCDKRVFALYGNAVYPVSLFSEPMMKEKAEEWGLMDVMRESRFCYHPINGVPCGICVPCRTKIRQHMDFLLSDDSRKRFYICEALERLGGKESDMPWDILYKVFLENRSNVALKGLEKMSETNQRLLSELFKRFRLLENLPLDRLVFINKHASSVKEVLNA